MNPVDWPDEPTLFPYSARHTLDARRLLVLAPHPDDEVLGCGGLIAASLELGAEVQVLVLSDGGQGGDPGVRESESIAAADVLAAGRGGLEMLFWRLPDRGLARVPGLVARLQHLIVSSGADRVLMPSPFEIHPDHRALCLAGLQALRAAAVDAEGLFYEVGQPLMPDLLVDISAQVDRKRAALRCFGSQLTQQAYDDQLLGLNRYRAYTLGPGVSHAEAYQRVTPSALQRGLVGVLDEVSQRLHQRFGGAAGPA